MEEDTENRALSTPMRKRKATPRGSSTAKKRHKNAEMEDTSSMDSLDSDSLATPRSVSKKRKATPRGSSTAKKRHKNAEMEDTPRTEDVSMAGFDKKFARVNEDYEQKNATPGANTIDSVPTPSAKKPAISVDAAFVSIDQVLKSFDKFEEGEDVAKKLMDSASRELAASDTSMESVTVDLTNKRRITEQGEVDSARLESEREKIIIAITRTEQVVERLRSDLDANKVALRKAWDNQDMLDEEFQNAVVQVVQVQAQNDQKRREHQAYQAEFLEFQGTMNKARTQFSNLSGEQVFAKLRLPFTYNLGHELTLPQMMSLAKFLKKGGFPGAKDLPCDDETGATMTILWDAICQAVGIVEE